MANYLGFLLTVRGKVIAVLLVKKKKDKKIKNGGLLFGRTYLDRSPLLAGIHDNHISFHY